MQLPLEDWAELKGPQLKLKLLERMVNSGAVQRKFWSKARVSVPDQCWNWEGFLTPKGYGFLQLYPPVGKKQKIYAHRAAYFFKFNTLPEACICHRCDNPKCVNPEHLFAGTYNDNNQDRVAKGRGAIGLKHASSKFTEEQIFEMRHLFYIRKVSNAEIARKYGATFNSVRDAVHGKTWRHLPMPDPMNDPMF